MIRVVGRSDRAFLRDVGEKGLDEVDESLLAKMCSFNQIRDFVVMPNYHAPSISPPKGYAASFISDVPFVAEVHHAMEKYCVITLAAVKMNQKEWTELTNDGAAFDRRIRKAFPHQVPLSGCAVSYAHDIPESGWAPALSLRNSRIGFVNYRDAGLDRYYVSCMSYLPDSTYEEMQTEEERISTSNLDFSAYYKLAVQDRQGGSSETGEEDAAAFAALEEIIRKSRDEILTNEAMFSPDSRNACMREVALENNKRLIGIFCRCLGVALASPLRPYSKSMFFSHFQRGFDAPGSESEMMEEYANFCKYRLPDESLVTAFLKNPKTNPKTQEGAALLIEALKWWPKNAPIYPFSVIPDIEIDSAYAARHANVAETYAYAKPEMRGYLIGVALHRLKYSEKPPGLQELKDTMMHEFDLNIIFEEQPMTFDANVETDINTFRRGQFGEVIIYNDCSSIQSISKGEQACGNGKDGGVIVANTPLNGVVVYNTVLSHDNKPPQHGGTHAITRNWSNATTLHAIPSMPLLVPGARMPSLPGEIDDISSRFFSALRGGVLSSGEDAELPLQLQCLQVCCVPKYISGEASREDIRTQLGFDMLPKDHPTGTGIFLHPVKTFLSEHIGHFPAYEFSN